MLSYNIFLIGVENEPADGVIGAGAEAGGVIVEAAIEDGTAVRELSAQHIGTGVVQSNGLVP